MYNSSTHGFSFLLIFGGIWWGWCLSEPSVIFPDTCEPEILSVTKGFIEPIELLSLLEQGGIWSLALSTFRQCVTWLYGEKKSWHACQYCYYNLLRWLSWEMYCLHAKGNWCLLFIYLFFCCYYERLSFFLFFFWVEHCRQHVLHVHSHCLGWVPLPSSLALSQLHKHTWIHSHSSSGLDICEYLRYVWGLVDLDRPE